jgi:hypothetical protein
MRIRQSAQFALAEKGVDALPLLNEVAAANPFPPIRFKEMIVCVVVAKGKGRFELCI